MACIVLAQSVMPCAEKSNYLTDVRTELKALAGKQSIPGPDVCSPFCTCSCCAGFSINHTIPTLSLLAFRHQTNYLPIIYTGIIKMPSPVWQPPQLV